MNKATIRDLDVSGKRVLIRVDFNCPLKDGEVTDDTRIEEALPTLNYLLEKGASLVLMSHLGRPKGSPKPELSLAPVARRLEQLMGRKVRMAPDCVGPETEAMVAELRPGDVLLLENLRFHKAEEKNDESFAKQLAAHGQLYVNDAFGSAHRAHASTHAVASFLPAVAGLLMARELDQLGAMLESPKRPFVAILGGAKVTDKIGVLESLVEKADAVLIGGGMAFTFLKARGKNIGTSLCEDDLDQPRRIEEKARANNTAFHLPSDVAVAPEVKTGQALRTVSVDDIPSDQMGLDIGPETIKVFAATITGAGTVFWNGPMGVFEVPPFDQGTLAVAQAIAESEAVSCVGGGDSAAALHQMGLADKITHVSTGGGASLEFMEGKVLPGVAVLRPREAVAGI